MSERDKESERRIREITDALPVVVYEADEIGKTAEIFEIKHANKQALFITFVEKAEPSRVIQPSAKVIQLDSTKRVKNRLQELESVIKELQSIIFLNESDRLHENRKSKAFTARNRHTHPIIGLPREFRELAGSKAEIYQTTHDGKLAFLVTVDKKVDNCCLQTPEIDTESRLSALETRIQSLEDTLINNNEIICSKNEKKKKIKGRGRDSNLRRGSTGPLPLPTAQMCH
jgi:hypothetical protein